MPYQKRSTRTYHYGMPVNANIMSEVPLLADKRDWNSTTHKFRDGSISEYCLFENQSRRSAAIQRIAELMKLNFWSQKQPI